MRHARCWIHGCLGALCLLLVGPLHAAELVKVMGKRVNLHYEEKVGLPTSCFGETST
mgnify:CR=1 FL=1